MGCRDKSGTCRRYHFLGTVSPRLVHHFSAFILSRSVFACAMRSMTHCSWVTFTTFFLIVMVSAVAASAGAVMLKAKIAARPAAKNVFIGSSSHPGTEPLG